jgi:hypothetical protein
MIKGSYSVISSSGSSCSPTLTGKSKICREENDLAKYRHMCRNSLVYCIWTFLITWWHILPLPPYLSDSRVKAQFLCTPQGVDVRLSSLLTSALQWRSMVNFMLGERAPSAY